MKTAAILGAVFGFLMGNAFALWALDPILAPLVRLKEQLDAERDKKDKA